jgi:hypothetical protein
VRHSGGLRQRAPGAVGAPTTSNAPADALALRQQLGARRRVLVGRTGPDLRAPGRRPARKAYQTVLDLWIHADTKLQPPVAEAHDALAGPGPGDERSP